MSPIHMERAEAGIRNVLAFIDALNRHDLPAMLQLVGEDCLFEAPSPPPDGTLYRGKAAIAQYWQGFLEQSPGARMKIEESIGYGLRSLIRWRCDWTDASAQAHHRRGMDLFRTHNGLIIEHLSYLKA